ncbi:type IV secretory system conjugative DNA transfer family protein [Duganella sp. PWIR1]
MRLRAPIRKPIRFIHPDFKSVARSQLGNGMLVFGSPGSGKTSIILPYVRQLIEDGEKLLTLDVKAEQRQKLGIPFLAPWLRGSLVLDIGNTITTKPQAQMLANQLIAVNESDKNKVWQKAANSVGASLIFDLVEKMPGRWGWSDLADQLELSVEQWAALMARVAPESAKILEGAAETSASVAFNVVTSLRNLRTVADQFAEAKKFGGKTFSLAGWLREKDYPIRQVILQVDEEYAASMGFIVPFIIEYIASQISGLPNNISDPKYIFLDEFAQLPAMLSLRVLYEIGRSKGFYLLLALQDWAQVKERYGEHIAAILFSAASLKIIAQTGIGHSQAELANLMGTQEVASVNVSQSHGGHSLGAAPSTSTTFANTIRPLLLPSELMSTIGPGDYIPNPIPGGDRIPTIIRAYFQAMSGDLFLLDWPVVHFPEKARAAQKLPGQHPRAEFLRAFMRDESKRPSERIRAAVGCKDLGMTWQDVAGLLFSDEWLTDDEWAKRDPKAPRVAVESAMAAMDARGEPVRIKRQRSQAVAAVLPTEPSEEPKKMASTAQASGGFDIDDLIRDHRDERGQKVYTGTGTTLRFEGLQREAAAPTHEAAEAVEKLAHMAEAAGHLLPHAAEAAHGLGLVHHALEVVEALEPKATPAPIMTPTATSESDEKQRRANPLLAAARARKQSTPKAEQ